MSVALEILTCRVCGAEFERKHRIGPTPLYCDEHSWKDFGKASREVKNAPHDKVLIDPAAFRRMLADADIPASRLALERGYDHSYVSQMLNRGFGNYFTIDAMCTRCGYRVEDILL